MYTPPHYREENLEAMQALMRQHSFGLLVSPGPEGLDATHLPFLLDTSRGGQGVLLGHMARANEQWRHLESAGEVLVVFSGPHAYVSPSWYKNPEGVPTWNYLAVHAYGQVRLLSEDALRGCLARMVTEYEASRPQPWSMERVSESYLAARLRGIVGFEIVISRLIGKRKLSQNRSAEDQVAVREALDAQGEPDSAAVARWMRNLTR